MRLLPFITCAAAMAGCTPGNPVTGQNKQDVTLNGEQAETASTSAIYGNQKILVVTYNDETSDPAIQFTANDRIVYPGASLLGWSYSTDDGSTWVYGGKLRPPRGVAALWGDPAIVTSKSDPNRVYISALAANGTIVPATGRHGAMATSGACVARSDDGGQHFATQSCFGAGTDFYDGAAMAAAGTATDHRIFAAYDDIDHGRIDVWASPDGLAPFQQLPDPFPGKSMLLHPRLAYDDATGALIVAAIGFNPTGPDNRIYMTRLVNGAWQAPVLASQPITGIAIPVGNQTIRMASGFSFDIGSASVIRPVVYGNFSGPLRTYADAIRLLYTTRDTSTQRLYVRGTACAADLSECDDVPQWGTTPGNFSNTPGHQWNPTVKAWRGARGSPPLWMATYQTTDDAPDKVSIKQGQLTRTAVGTPVFQPSPLMTPRNVCPDHRYGNGGYWGDYDEAAQIGLERNTAYFLLAFSDSSWGCFIQESYSSTHVHVRAIIYP